MFSRVQLLVIPWTIAHQAALSMKFSRQEYWSGLLFPCPGDLPHPGIESVSPASLVMGSRVFTTDPPENPKRVSGRFKSQPSTSVRLCFLVGKKDSKYL